jgi:hypothetical protein
MMKSGSLFQLGMQPLCFSDMSPHLGWYRDGTDISYQKNSIRKVWCKSYTKEGTSKVKCYFTLSFTISLRNAGDRVWIAHSFPYTYT